jgi:hypothetical protein
MRPEKQMLKAAVTPRSVDQDTSAMSWCALYDHRNLVQKQMVLRDECHLVVQEESIVPRWGTG